MESEENMDEVISANLPKAALSGIQNLRDDDRLQAAALEALRSGSTLPLVREELRTRILKKRLEEGKPEINTRASPPRTYQLTPHEMEKRERRKEQNRRAAKKCREKKKVEQCSVDQKYKTTLHTNKQLKEEVTALRKRKANLETFWLAHLAVCTLYPPTSSDGQNQQVHHHQQPTQHQQIPSEGRYATVMNSSSDLASQSASLDALDMDEAVGRLNSGVLDQLARGHSGGWQLAGQPMVGTEQHTPVTAASSTPMQVSITHTSTSMPASSLLPTSTPMNDINTMDLPGYPFWQQRHGEGPASKRARMSTPTPTFTTTSTAYLHATSTPQPLSSDIQQTGHIWTSSKFSNASPVSPVSSFMAAEKPSSRFASVTPPPPSPSVQQQVVPGTAEPTPSTSPAVFFPDDQATSLAGCIESASIPLCECLSSGFPDLAFDDFLLPSSQED